MIEENEVLLIAKEESGERLDKILANRFVELHSRTYFQYLIDEHLVLLNGEPVKKRIKPKEGDEVEIQFVVTPEIDLKPEPIPLEILYEDDYLLVINKPVGMVVHPAPGNWTGTFVNALLSHCREISPEGDLRPGIVHRLDKDTSGILVAAKSINVQQKLIESFASRNVFKEYTAICIGNPGSGEINAPIGRHPVHRKEMAIVSSGRKAQTFYKTLATNGKLSFIKAIITTGRTHQIRVHLKSLGTPLLGDSLYGSLQKNKTYEASRQMLHASLLRFVHPITGITVEIQSEPPLDMLKIMKKEKLYQKL